MRTNIAVHIVPLTHEFQTNRGKRKITSDYQGKFDFVYRGEQFIGHDPVDLQKQMRDHDVWADKEKADQAAAKAAALAAAEAQAAATPTAPAAPSVPPGRVYALYARLDADLERIEVRSWSNRGNRRDTVNVTLANGKKDSMSTNSLLGDLTDEEIATHAQLREARRATSKAKEAARPVNERRGSYDGHVTIAYDTTATKWVAQITAPVDPALVATHAADRPYEAEQAARHAITAHLYPWSVRDSYEAEPAVYATADATGHGGVVLFTTKEAAQAFADASTAANVAAAAYRDFMFAHRFDTNLVP